MAKRSTEWQLLTSQLVSDKTDTSASALELGVCKVIVTSLGGGMTLIEDDLLSALKELLETSQAMTSGRLPSAFELERYLRALEWSKRVISLAERDI